MAEVMTDDPMTVSTSEGLETVWPSCVATDFAICRFARRALDGIVSLRDILLHDLNEKDDEVA